MNSPLKIYYHRDFDGMASAALLAKALEECGKEDSILWDGVNFDRTLAWNSFGEGERFGVVDFHFHRNAAYWFDHHPTTFLTPEDEAAYQPSETHFFDPDSPSCPPIILKQAVENWGWVVPERFHDLVHWSNVIDSAGFDSAKQALYAKDPALRIMRALTCAPNLDFHNRVVESMKEETLIDTASDPDLERCYARACRNRDHAVEVFPTTIMERTVECLMADLRSKKLRRERFAPFYLYPELHYAVTLLPTRAGVHITAASNPWNRPPSPVHLGKILKGYGGGGHLYVAGCNPPSQKEALQWAREIYEQLSGVS